jgi:hypothetical protein
MSFYWHICFLEEKSFPTICDTPRFEVKQLLLTKITNKNHRSAMMPSEMVGWQCLYCAFINKDASGACIMCQKAHPKRHLIVAEEAVAAAEAATLADSAFEVNHLAGQFCETFLCCVERRF